MYHHVNDVFLNMMYVLTYLYLYLYLYIDVHIKYSYTGIMLHVFMFKKKKHTLCLKDVFLNYSFSTNGSADHCRTSDLSAFKQLTA